MSTLSIYVGLDYHDETIRVCVMTQAGEMRFKWGHEERSSSDCGTD